MRQLTVSLPDHVYDKFMDLCKQMPEVSVSDKNEQDVPLWQQALVLERIKNAKPEDYVDAKEALKKLKKKYAI